MRLRTVKILSIVILIVISVLSIIIFSFRESFFDFNTKIDSQKFSHFGDFISGILGGASILLLVLTYLFTRESHEVQQIEKYYENLNKDIDSALFNDKSGVEAYMNYDLENSVKNNLLDNLNLVLTNFEMYLKLIERNSLISHPTGEQYKIRFYLLFYAKVLWPLHETIIKNGMTFITKDKHDDSKIILPKYSKISIDCIEYLRTNEIVQASKFKDDNIDKFEEIKATAHRSRSAKA